MLRHALTGCLLALGLAVALSACKDHDEDKGTCVRKLGNIETCDVSQVRFQCTSLGGAAPQFFEGETAAAGVLRCKSLGYTLMSNMALPAHGTSYPIDTDSQIDSALEKGDSVSFGRPLSR